MCEDPRDDPVIKRWNKACDIHRRESCQSIKLYNRWSIGVVLVLTVMGGFALAGQRNAALDAREEADRQTDLARGAQAEAEKLTVEKIQFVKNIKALSRRYVDRAREELLRIREEAPDEVAGEQFASMRMAGEILRQGGIEDVEFWERYNDATTEILTQLARYLKPELDVAEVVIVESKDGQ